MLFQTRLAPQGAMHALPFIHSLSGRDTTSYSFGTGTKTRLVTAKSLDTSVWCSLSKMKNHTKLQWKSQIKQGNFFIAVYMYKGKPDEFTELSNLRVHKFLNNRSTRLTLLPPTEGALTEHLPMSARPSFQNSHNMAGLWGMITLFQYNTKRSCMAQ